MRSRKCANPSCKATYTPKKIGQKVCSIHCAIEFSKIEKAEAIKKAERKFDAQRRVALKSLRELAREAQTVCNEYVRLRDEKEPCISCGRHHDGQYHAGHFYTTAARPNLRFDLDNIHKQCSVCNNHLSGNIQLYRPALEKKIGAERLERLDNATEVKKYTREELIDIKAQFKALIKQLRDERRAYGNQG